MSSELFGVVMSRGESDAVVVNTSICVSVLIVENVVGRVNDIIGERDLSGHELGAEDVGNGGAQGEGRFVVGSATALSRVTVPDIVFVNVIDTYGLNAIGGLGHDSEKYLLRQKEPMIEGSHYFTISTPPCSRKMRRAS